MYALVEVYICGQEAGGGSRIVAKGSYEECEEALEQTKQERVDKWLEQGRGGDDPEDRIFVHQYEITEYDYGDSYTYNIVDLDNLPSHMDIY